MNEVDLVKRLSHRVTGLFIYGSLANGNFDTKSDIDIGFLGQGERFYRANSLDRWIDVSIKNPNASMIELSTCFRERIVPLTDEPRVRAVESQVKKSVINQACSFLSNQYYPKQVITDLETLLVSYYLNIEFKQNPHMIPKYVKRKFNQKFFKQLARHYESYLKPLKQEQYELLVTDGHLVIKPLKKEKNTPLIKLLLTTFWKKLTNRSTDWTGLALVIKGLLMKKSFIQEYYSDRVVKLEHTL